ncbi:MAG: hypothetical protein II748_04520 [Clostridia bacterium]|nr:hypothetical protein [Clostridia bacterium]
MGTFNSDLNNKICDMVSPVCVGLSPDWDKIPDELKERFKSSGAVLFVFNKAIIDAVSDIVPAVCLDFQKYLKYGIGGVVSLRSTIDYAKKKGLTVIVDTGTDCCLKESYSNGGYSENEGFEDIASSFLKAPGEDLPEQLRDGAFDADGVTVGLYSGCGSLNGEEIAKILVRKADRDRGVFFTYKEGAQGSGEILKAAKQASDASNGKISIGIYVKGADAKTAQKVRKEVGNAFILAENSSFAGTYFNEGPALIIVGDSIMYAYKNEKWAELYGEKGFADAAREETYDLISRINDLADM